MPFAVFLCFHIWQKAFFSYFCNAFSVQQHRLADIDNISVADLFVLLEKFGDYRGVYDE